MSHGSSVLYDAPGPRARRRTLIGSLLVAIVLAYGAYALVYQPLADKGQFTMAKWGPLVNPSDPSFALLWNRLRQGFTATVIAAGLAIASSLILGTALAVLRLGLQGLSQRRFPNLPMPVAVALRGLNTVLNAVTRFCVEVFRGIPVVITILFVWRGLPELGVHIDNLWYLVIGLTIYNMVVIGEILRSGMVGLPPGQREAAHALGLSNLQTLRMILLPQAFRIMLPALISQLVVVLKDTSLGFIISYEEVLAVSGQAIQILDNPIQMYAVVGAIFITVNYGLSKLAEYAQRRIAQGRAATPRAGRTPIEPTVDPIAA